MSPFDSVHRGAESFPYVRLIVSAINYMDNIYKGQYYLIIIITKITTIIIQLVTAEMAENGNYDTKLDESLISGGQ